MECEGGWNYAEVGRAPCDGAGFGRAEAEGMNRGGCKSSSSACPGCIRVDSNMPCGGMEAEKVLAVFEAFKAI